MHESFPNMWRAVFVVSCLALLCNLPPALGYRFSNIYRYPQNTVNRSASNFSKLAQGGRFCPAEDNQGLLRCATQYFAASGVAVGTSPEKLPNATLVLNYLFAGITDEQAYNNQQMRYRVFSSCVGTIPDGCWHVTNLMQLSQSTLDAYEYAELFDGLEFTFQNFENVKADLCAEQALQQSPCGTVPSSCDGFQSGINCFMSAYDKQKCPGGDVRRSLCKAEARMYFLGDWADDDCYSRLDQSCGSGAATLAVSALMAAVAAVTNTLLMLF